MKGRSARARRASRGFTLIELMIAGAIGVVVLAAGTLIVVQSARSSKRARDIAEMRRSAAMVFESLGTELRTAGLGVPRGRRKGATDRFPAPLLSGSNATAIHFLADVPRPNSGLNGFSRVADDCQTLLGGGTRPANGLPLLNELNNNCDIHAPATCNSTSASLTALAGSEDCSGDQTSSSCPWALGKYQPEEYLIVQDGDGSWSEVQVVSGPTIWETVGSRVTLALNSSNTGLLTRASGAFVATPDRIYYDYDVARRVITRQQCWGSVGNPIIDLDPPPPAARPCADDSTTGVETLADKVLGFQVTYRDASGVITANLALVRSIDVQLDLQGGPSDAPSTETFKTSIALREN